MSARPLIYYRQHFLGAETTASAVLTFGLTAWIEFGHGRHIVNGWLNSDRGPFYGAVAAVDGALLGFAIATAAIVLGFAPSDRFTLLRDSAHYPTLWRVFTSTIRALGLATLAALVALLLDHDTAHNAPAMIVFVGLQLWANFRLARTVWVLENVIRFVTKPIPSDA